MFLIVSCRNLRKLDNKVMSHGVSSTSFIIWSVSGTISLPRILNDLDRRPFAQRKRQYNRSRLQVIYAKSQHSLSLKNRIVTWACQLFSGQVLIAFQVLRASS